MSCSLELALVWSWSWSGLGLGGLTLDYNTAQQIEIIVLYYCGPDKQTPCCWFWVIVWFLHTKCDNPFCSGPSCVYILSKYLRLRRFSHTRCFPRSCEIMMLQLKSICNYCKRETCFFFSKWHNPGGFVLTRCTGDEINNNFQTHTPKKQKKARINYINLKTTTTKQLQNE